MSAVKTNSSDLLKWNRYIRDQSYSHSSAVLMINIPFLTGLHLAVITGDRFYSNFAHLKQALCQVMQLLKIVCKSLDDDTLCSQWSDSVMMTRTTCVACLFLDKFLYPIFKQNTQNINKN